MSDNLSLVIQDLCKALDGNRSRLMDIVRQVQSSFGCVSDEAVDLIAASLGIHRVEVESCVSFYSFLSRKPLGPVVIRLCDDVVDRQEGYDRVARAFCDALGIEIGETTPDGRISLQKTPCIGMCDQAPAALVNDEIFTNLTRDAAFEIVERLTHLESPENLDHKFGDGNNGHVLVHSMVCNNIRKTGPVIFAPLASGDALRKALAMSPVEVIRDVKTARLRGRGGAGFPTGMKWDFARSAPGEQRYVICNADEGEPGTFKDRVILTECADLLFEGMAIAGYAIGSDTGILYLRGEYAYLRPYLESILNQRRDKNLLGRAICGRSGFDFDIRIQMGAGAYVCGEETSLISSCEGLRGDPKNRPPFPAQKGYLQCPSIVNNVETFCCVSRVLDKGPGWFNQMGSAGSAGTKLLSISGDCKSPGVYEIEFGTSLGEVLKLAGGENAIAVQIGGPSGQMVGPADFGRAICYDHLATGGALVVFGPQRNLLEIADQYMHFFIEESCGYCTPCRVGNVLLEERLRKILDGQGTPSDIPYLRALGETVKRASRCGLGQTSAHPVLSTLKNFPELYDRLVREDPDGFRPSFDLEAQLTQAAAIAGRSSTHAAH